MNAIHPRKNKYGRYDRIWIGNSPYRFVRTEEDGTHLLQPVADGLLDGAPHRLTDAQVAHYQRLKRYKVDPAYFSTALDELRSQHDSSNLLSLSEEEVRDIMWKTEWCVRFHQARVAPDSGFRPTITPADIERFIEIHKDQMRRWYINKFKEPRPLGRPVLIGYDENGDEIKEHKEFDYPSPTALRNWLRKYDRAGERMAAFAPRYYRCGNRNQLHPEYVEVIEKCVKRYAHRSNPTRKDILDQIEGKLTTLKKKHPELSDLKLVAQRTVDRRIAKLDAFYVSVGRLGPDRAMRRYLAIAQGPDADLPMQRVEMDDWEADLQVLLTAAGQWQGMNDEQRAAVRRVRCTVTAAIDVRTRCIVGLNVSEAAPSTPGSIAALRTIVEDKSRLVEYAKARSPWPMQGLPEGLFTDGGPVFKGEFREAAMHCGIDFSRPDPDPRKRGYIESFFRYLRRFCRFFDGQTFSDVVKKGDYPAEAMATLTVDEFRKALIEFIVDFYHNRPHKGLEKSTPAAVWEREAAKHPPDEVTDAQKMAAFGIRNPKVAATPEGLVYLGIHYSSPGLHELRKKLGNGARFHTVVDPEDLGAILLLVPRAQREHMQKFAPLDMHGEFLRAEAVERRFKGTTLADHLLANAAVREFVREEAMAGRANRIQANESLTVFGRKVAQRAGVNSRGFTDEQYRRLEAKYRIAAERASSQGPVTNADAPSGEAGTGTIVATSTRRRKPSVPPARKDPHEAAIAPAQPPQAETAAAPDSMPPAKDPPSALRPPMPSRSVNQGDDE